LVYKVGSSIIYSKSASYKFQAGSISDAFGSSAICSFTPPPTDDIWQDKVIKKINKIPRRNKFVFPGGAKSMNSFALDSAYNDRLFKESDLSLHCLRHTFITWRIECGDPLPRVMYLAGHSNIETTMRYTHISAKKMRDIIRLL